MPLSSGFTLPISIILIPLGVFLIFYLFYSVFNIYHLLRFGVYGFGLYLISSFFVLGTIGLLALSGFYLSAYDWNAPIAFQNILEVNESNLPGL